MPRREIQVLIIGAREWSLIIHWAEGTSQM